MTESQRINEHIKKVVDWERTFEWMMYFGYMTFKKYKLAKDTQNEFENLGIKTKLESVYGRKFIVSLVD